MTSTPRSGDRDRPWHCWTAFAWTTRWQSSPARGGAHERRAAERPITIGAHVVRAGTIGALRFEVQGMVGGKPAIVVEHVTRLDDDLAPEWPQGRGYRVIITGVPSIRCDLDFADETGDLAMGAVLLTTATRLVNAIPAVCAAPTGLLSALDLPMITGRGLRSTGR